VCVCVRVLTEAIRQRRVDSSSRELTDDYDADDSFVMLMVIFVVIPLLGFSILIVFIYRRVTHDRSTYHGTLYRYRVSR